MFQYIFGHDEDLKVVCNQKMNPTQISQFSTMIQHGFRYKLYLDDLPSATMLRTPDGELVPDYQDGIPIGIYDRKNHQVIIYNHLIITVKTHFAVGSQEQRIVGFEVEPRSVDPASYSFLTRSYDPSLQKQIMSSDQEISFSVSIKTVNDKSTEWAHRMDHYWRMGNSKVHFMQILISIIIIILCALVICQILRCALQKEFNLLEMGNLIRNKQRKERGQRRAQGDEQEMSGLTGQRPKQIVEAENVAWKKLQGDVMRPPSYPNIFSCIMGMGAQVFFMTYMTMIYLLLFFATEEFRAYIFSAGLCILAVLGAVNGFFTCKLLKFYGATDWIFAAVVSSMVFPMWLFTTIATVDGVESLFREKMTTSFTGRFGYAILWFLINTISCFIGSYYGYMQPQEKSKIKVNSVKRRIPEQPCHLRLRYTCLVFGMIQFASVFTEFKYLIESVWRNQMYAMFGFLLVNFLLHSVVVAMLSVVQTYFTLCYQNYEWWWRSFWVGTSGAFYLMLYSVYYMLTEMDVDVFSSDLVYLLYMYMFCILFALMSGMISTFSSFLFIEFMYGRIKGE